MAVKAGYKTTEFWLVVLANAVIIAEKLQGILPPPWGEIALVVLNAAYTVSRTLAKQ